MNCPTSERKPSTINTLRYTVATALHRIEDANTGEVVVLRAVAQS